MNILKKLANGFLSLLSFISIFVVAIMLLLVVSDVVLRVFFNKPIVGATEIIQMMLVGMLLGFGKSCLGNDNLKVDFVMDFMPKRVQNIFGIITSSVCIVACLLLAWRAFENAMYSKAFGISYIMMRSIQQWPFILLVVLGFLGGAVGFALLIDRYVNALRNPEETVNKGDIEVLLEEEKKYQEGEDSHVD